MKAIIKTFTHVTVRRADLGREIRSLISYAVGCMFGRYSLDAEGIAYAGGKWDSSKYYTFQGGSKKIFRLSLIFERKSK